MVIQREYSTNPWWDLWPQTPYRRSTHPHGFFDDPFAGFMGRRMPLSCATEFKARQWYHHSNAENNSWISEDRKDENDSVEKDSDTKQSWGAYSKACVQRFYDAMFKAQQDDDIYLSDISDGDMDDEEELYRQPWLPALCLTMQDKKELSRYTMLSDKHMYAAQKLLKFQHPDMNGLQDTCLSQTSFQPATGESLQIHHIRGNHWVLTYSKGDGQVAVYDSLYDEVTDDLHDQLMDIYKVAGKRLRYSLPDAQKQRGSRDCGLFVVAFALELCEGRDPSAIRFNQKKMRKHLEKCFEDGVLEPFPQEE